LAQAEKKFTRKKGGEGKKIKLSERRAQSGRGEKKKKDFGLKRGAPISRIRYKCTQPLPAGEDAPVANRETLGKSSFLVQRKERVEIKAEGLGKIVKEREATPLRGEGGSKKIKEKETLCEVAVLRGKCEEKP